MAPSHLRSLLTCACSAFRHSFGGEPAHSSTAAVSAGSGFESAAKSVASSVRCSTPWTST
jgi:hypothetical protein